MTKPETVLGQSADFSKLPYRSKTTGHEANGDAAYVADSIVAPPFRGKTLRLNKGVHLHWAMPDALAQGVSHRADGDRQNLDFPTLPDRWCVTRSDRATGAVQKQWIVVSDYLYPEFHPVDTPPKDAVSFPVPVHENSDHGQPFRFMGRSWQAFPTNASWPKDLAYADFLNSFAAGMGAETDAKRALAQGLTVMGYGDPSFAAFYPNCHSVFGLHDEDITTTEGFADVCYDAVGWYDDPQTRDALRTKTSTSSPMDKAITAQLRRNAKEHDSAGHANNPPGTDDLWFEALSHLYDWVVDDPSDAAPDRLLCFGAVRAADDADFAYDPVKAQSDIRLAIGNTASEALSAALVDHCNADSSLLEEQLEALDLGEHLHHLQVDIGPKFREARHGKGFAAVRGGSVFTLRHEAIPQTTGEPSSAMDVPMGHYLPVFLAEALNRLNAAQMRFERGQDDIATLQAQIYRDWTLYMQCQRPPEGLHQELPDPIEMIRFIERTGLTPLRAAMAATGSAPAFQRSDEAGILSADLPEHTDPQAHSAKVAGEVTTVMEALEKLNATLAKINRLDQAIVREKVTKPPIEPPAPALPIVDMDASCALGDVWIAELSPDNKKILVMAGADRRGILSAETGELIAELGGLHSLNTQLRFAPDSASVIAASGLTFISFDAETGAELQRFKGHGNTITGLAFIQNGAQIVSSSYDGTVRFWDASTGVEDISRRIKASPKWLTALAVSKNETRIAVATNEPGRPVAILNFETGARICACDMHSHFSATRLEISADGVWVTATTSYGIAKLISAITGQSFLEFDNASVVVERPDLLMVAAGGKDGTIKLISSSANKKIETTLSHDAEIRALDFSPDCTQLLSLCTDGVVRVWDLATNHVLFEIETGKSARVAKFADDGLRVVIGRGNGGSTSVVQVAAKPVAPIARTFVEKHGIVLGASSQAEEFRQQLLDELPKLQSLQALINFEADLQATFGDDPSAKGLHLSKSRYCLRQIEGPRFHRPVDPVLLMIGDGVEPSSRHGADDRHRADGKLPCLSVELEQLPPITSWSAGAVPTGIATLRAHLNALPKTTHRPWERIWMHQPWHAFAMEWQTEVTPDDEGSNHEDGRSSYAEDFVARHYELPESEVALRRRAGDTGSKAADNGVYSGQVILVDHASPLMLAKLDRFLAEVDKAGPENAASASVHGTLRNVRDTLAKLPAVLSQRLDGLHEAFVQRQQTLQLPIDDPLGFREFAPFTQTVRKITVGRHGNAPMRDRDFMPLRSGTMTLRQVRLVDTFGRVKSVRSIGDETPVITAETLSVPDQPSVIALAPRLVQPARINFRWLSAGDHGAGNGDAVEMNTHPATSPVCGWIVPNLLDETLSVHDAQGATLGIVARRKDHLVWRPAIGDADPISDIGVTHPRVNRHLATLMRTLILDIGPKDKAFFPQFIATITTALETIAPEDFSTHRSLALLMGRPIAVVRAMVDLELKGAPVANQSLGAIVRDMATNGRTGQQGQRQRFALTLSEQRDFVAALDNKEVAGVRSVFDRRMIPFPTRDDAVALRRSSTSRGQGPWTILFEDQCFHVRVSDDQVQVCETSNRTTDDFGHVKVPIRVGEDQQLNDGLIGYFIEDPDQGAAGYGYRRNAFYAPQSAERIEVAPGIILDNVQPLVDQLDRRTAPSQVLERLAITDTAEVTINKPGHRWRLETAERVYNIVRAATGLELEEIRQNSSAHVKTHWKEPINLMQSVDDVAQKLTMLIDPQGAVHATSGILPTKAITLPREYFADALRNIEVSLRIGPILTEIDRMKLPLWEQEGYEWAFLKETSTGWSINTEIDAPAKGAEFPVRQRLVDGWLRLRPLVK